MFFFLLLLSHILHWVFLFCMFQGLVVSMRHMGGSRTNTLHPTLGRPGLDVARNWSSGVHLCHVLSPDKTSTEDATWILQAPTRSHKYNKCWASPLMRCQIGEMYGSFLRYFWAILRVAGKKCGMDIGENSTWCKCAFLLGMHCRRSGRIQFLLN